MIFLLIPHIFGILEINQIQILKLLSFKCKVLKFKQNNLISDLKEVSETLFQSCLCPGENEIFLNDFFNITEGISEMRDENVDSDKGGKRRGRGKKGKRKKGKGKKGKNKNS